MTWPVRDRLGPWVEVAACRNMNTDIFFPSRWESNKPAKAVCAGCIVRSECLDYAMLHPHIAGIFGGTAEWEREEMRRKRRYL